MFEVCAEIKFQSNLKSTKIIVNTLLKCLKNDIINLSEEELFDLRIIFSELISNAIIHGNKCDENKTVELIVKTDGEIILSSICDEGEGFDYTQWFINKGCVQSAYSEFGRGLVLVCSLTDSIAFNEAGNKIEFYKILNNGNANLLKGAEDLICSAG